jgi:hypothetical protein
MAIDTKAKRASCIAAGIPLLPASPIPNGSLDASVRAAACWSYSGNLFAAPLTFVPLTFALEAGLSRLTSLDAGLSQTVGMTAELTRTLSLEAKR